MSNNFLCQVDGRRSWAALVARVQKAREKVEHLAEIESLDRPEHYQELLRETALEFQILACAMRRVIFSNVSISREEYLLKAAEAMGIRFDLSDQAFRIVLPAQFPNRQWKSCRYLTDPLMAVMRDLARKTPLPRFPEASVSFIHFSEIPTYEYDEIESKQTLDVLSTFLLRDDCPLFCDVSHFFRTGSISRTEVIVTARKDFPRLLLEEDIHAAENP